MEKPREDTPIDAYREHAAFTIAGVAADPDVAGLEKGLAKEHHALKKQTRALEDMEEEIQKKKAVLMIKDRCCDEVVRAFELRLLGLVNKKRGDPQYRRYFPDGLREVTEAEPRKVEPALVKDIITALEEDEGKPGIGPLATEFKPQFQAAVGDVKSADKDLSATETEARHLRDKTIPGIKSAWGDEYVKLHGALRGKLPRDPARVEAFFYPFKKERKKPVEDGGGGAPEGGGAPGGGEQPG